ncbi:hypothetical protein [Verrucomicrobium sp. BvORR106]|uniref:hypothetical protein n=1 Tax=Verrucomicrobium sp. BvORR106 TaxID=1403819 RepID=UPI000571D172|nr:hypothetical protein [Verrucomicrobium sp. BvORR106]
MDIIQADTVLRCKRAFLGRAQDLHDKQKFKGREILAGMALALGEMAAILNPAANASEAKEALMQAVARGFDVATEERGGQSVPSKGQGNSGGIAP